MSNNMELTEYITMKSNKGVLQKYLKKKRVSMFYCHRKLPLMLLLFSH